MTFDISFRFSHTGSSFAEIRYCKDDPLDRGRNAVGIGENREAEITQYHRGRDADHPRPTSRHIMTMKPTMTKMDARRPFGPEAVSERVNRGKLPCYLITSTAKIAQ